MMAYEPMLLIAVMGFYLVAGSFRVDEIITAEAPLLAVPAGYLRGLPFHPHDQAAQEPL
jgi:formate hydrogenlyase subunit 4